MKMDCQMRADGVRSGNKPHTRFQSSKNHAGQPNRPFVSCLRKSRVATVRRTSDGPAGKEPSSVATEDQRYACRECGFDWRPVLASASRVAGARPGAPGANVINLDGTGVVQ